MKSLPEKTPSNTELYNEQTNQNLNDIETDFISSKTKKILVIIIFIIIIIVNVIILILKFEKKISEDEKFIIFNNISASYIVSKNEEFMVFNPKKLNLSNSEYFVKIKNQTKLRLLKNIELNDGKMISPLEGILNLTIVILKEIDNLNGLFSGCSKLKNIDLSNLNSFKVTNYDSFFEGCSSLETINFPINKSNIVYSMNNMFEGCENLKNVNLSSFNISNTVSMNNIFSRCNNIKNIDISTFNYIKEEFFNGINSDINILTNNFLASEIKNIKPINIHINTFLNENIQQNLCKIGEESKCKICGDFFNFLCTECYDGFYLYINNFLGIICKKCEIENCNKCYSTFNDVICSSCNEGYQLVLNECISNIEITKKCEIGENEKCLSCNNEKGKEDECLNCNEGYYLPKSQNNQTFCKKCEIDKCINCEENLNKEIICNECQNGYKLKNNKCVIIVPDCIIGEGSLCSSCRTEDERLDECLTCNDGYYIINDEIKNKSICQKCPIDYCKKCEIKNGKNICIECENNYILQIDDEQNQYCRKCEIGIGDKCKTCGNKFGVCESCNGGYILDKNGSCLENGNSVLVTYETNKKGESIRLFEHYYNNDNYYVINKTEIQFFENDIEIFPTFESGFICEICWPYADFFVYKFDEIGNHTIKIVFKSQLKTMKHFFAGCNNIISIKFSPSFDTSNVNNMERLFCFCDNLIDLDISMFNTSNVVIMDFMFEESHKIKRLDLSNFDTRKLENADGIFSYSYNLEYLDLSSWDTSNIKNNTMFRFMPTNVTLKISNKFLKNNIYIPSTWEVINIDKL